MIKKILLAMLGFWLCHVPAQAAHTVLVLGDSLSAGLGLPREAAWVSLLQQRLQREHPTWRVANASISGETSSGGLYRIDPLLAEQRPAIVILELGANDGLRGLDLDITRHNLDSMIQRAQRSGAKVLLIGMRLPPNYGKAYTEKFQRMYGGLAQQHRLAYVPFLFAAIGDQREYFQDDNLHPNAQAQPLLLDTVWPALKPLLRH